MQVITDAVFNFIFQLYQLTGSLGLAIIIFTVLLRAVMFPLTLSSLKAMNNVRQLQPEISKLKKKHKGDNASMQKAQMELYKKYNVNPLAGCLPQILQIAVTYVLYHILINFFKAPEVNGEVLNTIFLGLHLNVPDPTYVLPILAGVTQLFLSLMIAPGAEKKDEVANDSKKKKVQEENKKEEDFAEMAQTMQQQMIFIMPVMIGILAIGFPAGLSLYWVVTTLFSIGQQWYVSGWGGITLYYNRLKTMLASRLSPGSN
jgi:YidC/Oxa1 family membrane protein insertase